VDGEREVLQHSSVLPRSSQQLIAHLWQDQAFAAYYGEFREYNFTIIYTVVVIVALSHCRSCTRTHLVRVLLVC
jgi:hypothetical protein